MQVPHGALRLHVMGERGARRDVATADDIATMARIARDADTVRTYVGAFSEAGCDELIFFPTVNDPDQVDLLADAAGL